MKTHAAKDGCPACITDARGRPRLRERLCRFLRLSLNVKLGDVDLILAEEARAEAELLAASKRDAARMAERVPAYRRCA